MNYTFCALVMLVGAAVFLGVYFFVDRCLTMHRVKINQAEWDAYSAGMNFDQRFEVYNEWCKESKMRHGWPHYYFPRI